MALSQPTAHSLWKKIADEENWRPRSVAGGKFLLPTSVQSQKLVLVQFLPFPPVSVQISGPPQSSAWLFCGSYQLFTSFPNHLLLVDCFFPSSPTCLRTPVCFFVTLLQSDCQRAFLSPRNVWGDRGRKNQTQVTLISMGTSTQTRVLLYDGLSTGVSPTAHTIYRGVCVCEQPYLILPSTLRQKTLYHKQFAGDRPS